MPLLARSFPALISVLLLAISIQMLSSSGIVRAHAELESSSPPAGGTITSLPPSMTLVFTEEVKPGSVSVTVTGQDGERADNGGAAVDLDDPERTRVIVPLLAGGDGAYTVQWQAISNIDSDQTEGTYTFTVAAVSGSPVTGSAATPAGVTVEPSPQLTPTLNPDRNGNPLPINSDYDSRALAISVGVGLVALAAIVGFWLLVRPRNPRFGPRSRPDKD